MAVGGWRQLQERGTHSNGKTFIFLAAVADGQTAANRGGKGRTTQNTHPESAFGRVLIGALGRSLICLCLLVLSEVSQRGWREGVGDKQTSKKEQPKVLQ